MRKVGWLRAAFLAAVAAPCVSGCVYQEWVHSSAEQGDYAQLIAHVRSNTELQGQLDTRTERMFREGPPVENWQELGVDILALLAEQAGGIANNVMHREEGGLALYAFYHPHDDLLGPEYRTYHVDGPEDLFSSAGAVSHSLMQIAPGLWLQMATRYGLMGHAFCGQTAAARLHARRPFAELTTSEVGDLAALVSGVQRIARNPPNCGIYIPQGGSRWQAIHFTPAGRSLPEADQEERPLQIIPLAQVRQMIESD